MTPSHALMSSVSPSATRWLAPLLLALVLTALTAVPAQAHTEIVATTPQAGATVTEPPIEVIIEFGGDLDPDGTVDVRVLDPLGDDLVAAPPTVDGRVVTVPLNLAVAEGEHTVDVAFTAADGDDQVQSFSFTYGPPAAIATPTATLSGAPVQPAQTPTPTPTPTPTATEATEATQTETVEATQTETVEATSGDEELVSADDGGIGILPIIIAIAVAVAAAGVVLLRLRPPDLQAADVADPDEHR